MSVCPLSQPHKVLDVFIYLGILIYRKCFPPKVLLRYNFNSLFVLPRAMNVMPKAVREEREVLGAVVLLGVLLPIEPFLNSCFPLSH